MPWLTHHLQNILQQKLSKNACFANNVAILHDHIMDKDIRMIFVLCQYYIVCEQAIHTDANQSD